MREELHEKGSRLPWSEQTPRRGVAHVHTEVPAMRRTLRPAFAFAASLALLVLAGAAPVTVRANGFPQQADTWVATSGTPTGSTAGSSCAHPGFVVDGVEDEVEIGYAITDVTAGGTVHLCAGVYHVTTGQGYGKSFTLAGAGRDATVIVGTAEFNESDAYVSGGSEFLWDGAPYDHTLSVRDLTIRGFYGDGYGALYGNDFVLDRVRMDHNGGLDGSPGAISGGNVTVRNSIISKNYSTDDGGAIGASRLVASYSTFADNVSDGDGGAFDAITGSLARVDLFRNRAAGNGGAASIGGYGDFTITRSRFWKNHADSAGGAISADTSNLSIVLSRFTTNVSDHDAGAIRAEHATLSIVSSRFGHNSTTGYGGAVLAVRQSSFVVSRSTFYKNRATGFAGAILVSQGAALQKIERSIFLRNSATLGGGAIFMDGGDYQVGGVTADLSGVRLNSFLRNSGADGGAITVSLCDATSAASKALIRRVNRYQENTSSTGEPAVFFASYGC